VVSVLLGSLFDDLEVGDGKCAVKKLTRLIQENHMLRNWAIALRTKCING
jgi:hypothetical protein